MGVYIKGMEMPVTCCHCPLMGYDPDIELVDGGGETQGAYICVITHELIDNTKREEHCPLVPVSPHGRLIDADALRKSMYHDAFETDTPMQKWDGGCWIRYKLFELQEEAAPTIIPAEEWKP